MDNTDSSNIKQRRSKLRRRRFLIFLIAIASVALGFFATKLFFSTNFANHPIVGQWISVEDEVWTYQFNNDGTGSFGLVIGTPSEFQYSIINKGTLRIEFKNSAKYDYPFTLSGNQLTITELHGGKTVYRKN